MSPIEECENGNNLNDDGCSSKCKVETGWNCTGSPLSVCVPICGDKIKVPTEGCDDSNSTDGDGCLPDCSGAMSEYSCSGGNKTHPDTCIPKCGDGYVFPGEICDDGTNDNIGCASGC